jgi:hypothetical protein
MQEVRRLAVVGGGPVGVEAALYGSRLGYRVSLYEAAEVGAHMLSWGHVRMFSPWWMNISSLGVNTLQSQGWQPPDADKCPTGRDFVRQYLRPLAESIAPRVALHTGVRVVAIGRDDHLKGDAIGDESRRKAPFRLLLDKDGEERISYVERVIDASGVYGQHNWLGSGGIPAAGERSASGRIAYRLEDYGGAARGKYAGARVLVVGSGHSAATAVCALARLAKSEPGTTIDWVVRSRRRPPVPVFVDDPLPLRDQLAREANHIAEGVHPAVRYRDGYVVSEVRPRGDELHVLLQPSGSGGGERALTAGAPLRVDRVVALVGYRPDLDLGRELQLHTCWATEGPMKLAATMLGATGGDCLAQRSPGFEALAMPEDGCLWLGHKSYGRNASFLLRVGHTQIRDAFRLWEGDPELDLYTDPDPAALAASGS